MDPVKLDPAALKGLSKKELARLVLKLSGEIAERDREIEEHRTWKQEVADVLRRIAENAERMKLQARQYYLTSNDPTAKDINAQIDRIVAVQITTLHRLSGLLHGMKPGSEKGNSKARKKVRGTIHDKNESDKSEDASAGKRKKTGYRDTPIEQLKCLLNALFKTDSKAEADAIMDKIQKIIEANKPPFEPREPNNKNKGRRSNKDELEEEEFDFAEMPPMKSCPHCGKTAIQQSVVDQMIKTKPTVMKQNDGLTTPVRTHNYLCPYCNKYHTVSQGNDYPIATTRNIGLKPVVQSFYLHYLGMALNRAGASFENGALLGSDTLNRNCFEWGRIFLLPVYEAILDRLKEQKVLVADETTYDVTQAMGYGKKSEENKNSEGTCNQTYVLSFGTAFRSLVQLHAYALMEGRGGEAIAKILDASYKFMVLITDAYQGYDKVLENHPYSKHQVCLIHFRRHLINGAWGVQVSRDFMALDEAAQIAVMERARKENSIFYRVARIFQAIAYVFNWEQEIPKARGDPKKLAEIRKKQTALMDLVDTLMDELSEGRIQQLTEGGKWTACSDADTLAQACTFYANNRDNFRHFLKEDNYEIPPDSSVVEQNIRPVALIRNNSHFFVNADYAKVALAAFIYLCKGVHNRLYVNRSHMHS